MTPGRGACHSQPDPDRRRQGLGALVPAWASGRTSSTSTTQATPRNLFGFRDGTNNLKAEEPGSSTSTSGSNPKTSRPCPGRVAGRRVLPGRPPDPDAHRGLGQHEPAGAGTNLRAPQGQGRADGWQEEFDAPDFNRLGRTAGRQSRAPATSSLPTRHNWAAYESCVVATTSPTAATGWGGWMPGSSSSPSCAMRTSSSCRCSERSRPRTASTNTSSTTARPSSPARPASPTTTTTTSGADPPHLTSRMPWAPSASAIACVTKG